jgi:hypothetical protein
MGATAKRLPPDRQEDTHDEEEGASEVHSHGFMACRGLEMLMLASV